jgi:hypothetical protein
MMRMFYFDVTLRIVHSGRRLDVALYKGVRAANELAARRAVLNRFLDDGLQVVRLGRAAERSRGER